MDSHIQSKEKHMSSQQIFKVYAFNLVKSVIHVNNKVVVHIYFALIICFV